MGVFVALRDICFMEQRTTWYTVPETMACVPRVGDKIYPPKQPTETWTVMKVVHRPATRYTLELPMVEVHYRTEVPLRHPRPALQPGQQIRTG